MNLLQTLTIVLIQFGVGSLLLVSLLPTREIRVGFFLTNTIISTIALALAVIFTKLGAGVTWWDTRYLLLTLAGAVLAYGCFKLEKMKAGRVILIVTGVIGVGFDLLPLAGQVLAARGMTTTVPYLFTATILAGAFLFGATHVGMILGHWYLLMRKLSFEYLDQFGKLLLAAVVVRGLVIVVFLTILPQQDPRLAGNFLFNLYAPERQLFFFVFRLLFGVAIPLVLGYMVRRCVKRRANQAATGLLYVAEISVLFGELFAAVLLV